MSTLKVNTIQNTSAAHDSTPEQLARGRVKTWVNFDMNAGSITDSFGVSSITDDGTGLFTITYSSAFSNTNYCILSVCPETIITRIAHRACTRNDTQRPPVRRVARRGALGRATTPVASSGRRTLLAR